MKQDCIVCPEELVNEVDIIDITRQTPPERSNPVSPTDTVLQDGRQSLCFHSEFLLFFCRLSLPARHRMRGAFSYPAKLGDEVLEVHGILLVRDLKSVSFIAFRRFEEPVYCLLPALHPATVSSFP